MVTVKEQLHHFCIAWLGQRAAQINNIIADARQAVAAETKSSAGDKYETTRELMQQEIDLNLARLAELDKTRSIMNHINPTQTSHIILPGSVVYTSNGNFFISISAGQINIEGVSFYAVSAASPIGAKLLGKTAGHSFELNGKAFVITDVM